ncbi:MAG: hypothetical protein DHS20C13_31120 [Thermodesulfobacteriota bacterium]|nr:MAG: hypothetical protein DHS20C13_31120 [Thermodesulfobacteriota bacterium]
MTRFYILFVLMGVLSCVPKDLVQEIRDAEESEVTDLGKNGKIVKIN